MQQVALKVNKIYPGLTMNWRFFLIFSLFFPIFAYGTVRNFHAIEPGQAYRSAQPSAQDLPILIEKYQIKTIINLRGETPADWWVKERDICSKHKVKLINIPFSASRLPDPAALLQLYDAFFEEHPVLIHCEGGANRTGAASALWRMTVLGEERAKAAGQLSEKYFHFKRLYPMMDKLVEIYEPDREWVLHEYPIHCPSTLPA